MNVSRLTLALALSVGMAGTTSSQVLAQQCDGNCDARTCKSCCDDQGLLDRLGTAAARLESRLRGQVAQIAHISPSVCDKAAGQCDVMSNTKCDHCGGAKTHSHAPQQTRNTESFVPEPSRITPNPNSELKHGPTVPPPVTDDPANDAKIDPFRDDTALYWRSSPSGARSVGYLRHIAGSSEQEVDTSSYYAEAFSPQAFNGYRRSISSASPASPAGHIAAHNALSTQQSSRHVRGQAVETRHESIGKQPVAGVVPASAVAPVTASASARISDYDYRAQPLAQPLPVRTAGYGASVPVNPLRNHR